MDVNTDPIDRPQIVDSTPSIKIFDVCNEFKAVKNFSAIVCAKRRSGKSVLVKDILSQIKNNYAECHVFSNTAHLQQDLFDYVPPENVYYGLDAPILDRIYSDQERYILEQTKKKKDKKKLKHILLIFDDIISDKKIRHSQTFDKLFIESRHINIAVIGISQYLSGAHGFNALARKNCDFFFTFYPDCDRDKELICNDFLSVKSRKEGKALLESICLEPYTVLCVANHKVAREYEDYVYRYKASLDVRKFTIGNNEYLKHQKEPFIGNEQYEQRLNLRISSSNPTQIRELQIRFRDQGERETF